MTLPDPGDMTSSPGWRMGETIIVRPRRCLLSPDGAHNFDGHVVDGIVISMHCRRCGLILPEASDDPA